MFLLPTAQTRDKDDVKPEQMLNLINELKAESDYVLIDCPAGIEQGFENAVVGADRAIIVVNPEVTSIRDADRVIGKLDARGLDNHQVIVNRIDYDMVKKGDMLGIEDVIDNLAIKLIGVVPNDKEITISTNKGEPIVLTQNAKAGKAFRDIAKRITGEEVPFQSYEEHNSGFVAAIKKLFNVK